MSSLITTLVSKWDARNCIHRVQEVFKKDGQGWSLGHHILEGLLDKKMFEKAVSVEAIRQAIQDFEFYTLDQILPLLRANLQEKKVNHPHFEKTIKEIFTDCPSYTVRTEEFVKELTKAEQEAKPGDRIFIPLSSSGEGTITLLSHPLFTSKPGEEPEPVVIQKTCDLESATAATTATVVAPTSASRGAGIKSRSKSDLHASEETQFRTADAGDVEDPLVDTDHSNLIMPLTEEGEGEMEAEAAEVDAAEVEAEDVDSTVPEEEEQEEKEPVAAVVVVQAEPSEYKDPPPSKAVPMDAWLPEHRERRMDEMKIPGIIRFCQVRALIESFGNLDLKIRKIWTCCEKNKLVDPVTGLISVDQLYAACKKDSNIRFSTKKEKCSKVVVTHFMNEWKKEHERYTFQMKEYKALHAKWSKNKKKLKRPSMPKTPTAKTWDHLLDDIYQEMMPPVLPLEQMEEANDVLVNENSKNEIEKLILKAKKFLQKELEEKERKELKALKEREKKELKSDKRTSEDLTVPTSASSLTSATTETSTSAEVATIPEETTSSSSSSSSASSSADSDYQAVNLNQLDGNVIVRFGQLCEILQRNLLLCQFMQSMVETESGNILADRPKRIFEQLKGVLDTEPVGVHMSSQMLAALQSKNWGVDVTKQICSKEYNFDELYVVSIENLKASNRIVPVQSVAKNDDDIMSTRVSLPVNSVSTK